MKTCNILLSSLASAALISGAAFAQSAEGVTGTDDAPAAAQPAEGGDGTLLLRNTVDDAADGETGMDGTRDDPAMAEDAGETESPTAVPEMGMAADPEDATTEDGTDDNAVVADDADRPMGEGLYGAFADARVSDLIGMNVLGGTGERVGEVDRLVNVAGTPNAVVGVGGFLGLGERDVAIPLDRFSRTEDGLMLDALTEDDLEAMPEWDKSGEDMPLDATIGESM